MKLKIAIIIVNYNGYDDTVECVKSLLNITYNNVKIFVVDNGSTDEKKIAKDEFLNNIAYIIQSSENLGFSGGNNIAIQKALEEKFDYVLLLNNDTIVKPDFLDELVKAAETDNDIGIAAGKIYCYYEQDRVWSAGGDFNRKTGIIEQFGGREREEINIPKDVTFATGCLMLIPVDVIKKIGWLNDEFFLYSEDVEYCQRVLDAGYRIRYVPSAQIYHKVSATTGDGSSIQQRYMIRNNLYVIEKYCEKKWIAYFCLTMQNLKHIIRKRKQLKPLLCGVRDYCTGRKGKIYSD